MSVNEQRGRFVRALAEYLAGTNQARKSIRLQMGADDGLEWAAIRNETPLRGYPTVDEAEKQLIDFFGWKSAVKPSRAI